MGGYCPLLHLVLVLRTAEGVGLIRLRLTLRARIKDFGFLNEILILL